MIFRSDLEALQAVLCNARLNVVLKLNECDSLFARDQTNFTEAREPLQGLVCNRKSRKEQERAGKSRKEQESTYCWNNMLSIMEVVSSGKF